MRGLLMNIDRAIKIYTRQEESYGLQVVSESVLRKTSGTLLR